MGASSSPIRICPECAARNSGLSLFCAECGASLTNAVNANDDDGQTTATYRPIPDQEPTSDPYATQQFTPQSTLSTYPDSASVEDQSWNGATRVSAGFAPEPESRRGLVLGWIAGVLILLVIGYLGWTSFLDPDTRDSIIGIFG